MHISLRTALCLPFLALAACEDMSATGSSDPQGPSKRSCIRAVETHTGISGATINTTIPIVETGQHIIDLPGSPSWTCYTDETGAARELIETRLG
ncbi:hypothetical protein [Sulfitobacter litoralis]|jgi:hypothetical protein|uniref:hypothetical protein n=1 Tax=Sulfitobacter litoralis TaxID=335975 RepID=UPI002B26E1FF|nr:hypothetical protein [Sulfitobacter litoralis]|tara:strand:- start:622 stop:906 length:285 start_codon:yes stop_codon:yes gene_type:complete